MRAYDGCDARFGHATGFVVDARRGIILTNRHVVTDGPITADAVFLSKEEVTLTPFYRDPLHDFGFFSFEPSEVRHQVLEEIELAPADAQVRVPPCSALTGVTCAGKWHPDKNRGGV